MDLGQRNMTSQNNGNERIRSPGNMTTPVHGNGRTQATMGSRQDMAMNMNNQPIINRTPSTPASYPHQQQRTMSQTPAPPYNQHHMPTQPLQAQNIPYQDVGRAPSRSGSINHTPQNRTLSHTPQNISQSAAASNLFSSTNSAWNRYVPQKERTPSGNMLPTPYSEEPFEKYMSLLQQSGPNLGPPLYPQNMSDQYRSVSQYPQQTNIPSQLPTYDNTWAQSQSRSQTQIPTGTSCLSCEHKLDRIERKLDLLLSYFEKSIPLGCGYGSTQSTPSYSAVGGSIGNTTPLGSVESRIGYNSGTAPNSLQGQQTARQMTSASQISLGQPEPQMTRTQFPGSIPHNSQRLGGGITAPNGAGTTLEFKNSRSTLNQIPPSHGTPVHHQVGSGGTYNSSSVPNKTSGLLPSAQDNNIGQQNAGGRNETQGGGNVNNPQVVNYMSNTGNDRGHHQETRKVTFDVPQNVSPRNNRLEATVKDSSQTSSGVDTIRNVKKVQSMGETHRRNKGKAKPKKDLQSQSVQTDDEETAEQRSVEGTKGGRGEDHEKEAPDKLNDASDTNAPQVQDGVGNPQDASRDLDDDDEDMGSLEIDDLDFTKIANMDGDKNKGSTDLFFMDEPDAKLVDNSPYNTRHKQTIWKIGGTQISKKSPEEGKTLTKGDDIKEEKVLAVKEETGKRGRYSTRSKDSPVPSKKIKANEKEKQNQSEDEKDDSPPAKRPYVRKMSFENPYTDKLSNEAIFKLYKKYRKPHLFAIYVVKALFTKNEIYESNCYGIRGKPYDPDRLNFVKQVVMHFFCPRSEKKQEAIWKDCRVKINRAGQRLREDARKKYIPGLTVAPPPKYQPIKPSHHVFQTDDEDEDEIDSDESFAEEK